MNPTHLNILLDRVEATGNRARACAKNAVDDYLAAAIEEIRRELKGILDPGSANAVRQQSTKTSCSKNAPSSTPGGSVAP